MVEHPTQPDITGALLESWRTSPYLTTTTDRNKNHHHVGSACACVCVCVLIKATVLFFSSQCLCILGVGDTATHYSRSPNTEAVSSQHPSPQALHAVSTKKTHTHILAHSAHLPICNFPERGRLTCFYC